MSGHAFLSLIRENSGLRTSGEPCIKWSPKKDHAIYIYRENRDSVDSVDYIVFIVMDKHSRGTLCFSHSVGIRSEIRDQSQDTTVTILLLLLDYSY